MSKRRSAQPPTTGAKVGRPQASRRSDQEGALARGYRTAPIGLTSFDTELRFVQINDWLAAMNGLPVEEHLGRKLADVLPHIAPGIHDQLRSVLETGEPILAGHLSAEIPSLSGSTNHYEYNFFPEKSADGTVVGVRCFFSNTTERMQAQEAIRELTEKLEVRFKTLVEHSPDAMIITDRTGTIEQLNEKAASLFGYEDGELRGKPVSVLISPQLAEAHDRHLAQFSKRPTNREMGAGRELRAVRKDGASFPVQISLSPLGTEENASIAASIRDISEHKEREQKLRNALDEVIELKSRVEQDNRDLKEGLKSSRAGRHEIINESKPMKRLLSQAEKVAPTNSTVLILGETGTGKEVLARFIHEHSLRHERPMLKVNCGALPATLIEAELFGRERGAYTGALSRQMGRFEAADGGTILLDEIGDLPLELQVKLLRVIQEGQFERLGSSKTFQVDARVLAATNLDLERAVSEGTFRADLFYRLNVFPLTVPPLRERRDDIPRLVWTFIQELREPTGKTIDTVSRPTMEALKHEDWPGNVRELRNVLERSMILGSGSSLQVDVSSTASASSSPLPQDTYRLEDVDRHHITKTLEKTGWRVRGEHGASDLLGLKPSTLEHRMKKLGIRRPGS